MLERLTIGGYRAYRRVQHFEFQRPANGCLGLNVLVGQNNSGKSTPLGIIRELFQQTPDFIADSQSRYDGEDISIRLGLDFDGQKQELFCEKRDKAFHVKLIRGLQEKQSEARRNELRQRIKFVPSRRAWTDRFGRGARPNQRQLEENLYNIQANQEAPLGSILADIIRSGNKEDFDKYLKSVLPEIVNWSIDSFMDQDFIVYLNASGRSHALGLLGDGFSSIFRLAHILFSSNPGDVVILDEPELSLHPEAQKSLYHLISRLSSDRQIIIATHSPYMVNWADLANGGRLFRLSLDQDGYTEVNVLQQAAIDRVLPAVRADIRNRKLFDVLAKEVFFRDAVVFCEGQEDVHYIENYLHGLSLPPLPMFGYGSGGASWIDKWISLAVSLDIRAGAIFDANEVEEANRVKRSYQENSNVKVWVIAANDIRDKERNGEVECGVFDRRGEINSQYQLEFTDMLKDLSSWLRAGRHV